eukprot:TRINITY_DN9602_c0_g1_i1.p1 TRINITY_DN9602_c0_g1~~TRINITY_DN9602_c0_g1_i1.p1  ORF type:complete len:788 (+),score=130.47 TRINITY_DN9602_c0_g1_i1:97-2460(+)
MARNALGASSPHKKRHKSRSLSSKRKKKVRSKSRARRDRSRSESSERSRSDSRKRKSGKKKCGSDKRSRSNSKRRSRSVSVTKKGGKKRSRSRKARSRSPRARSKSRKGRSRSKSQKCSRSHKQRSRSKSRKRSRSKSARKRSQSNRKSPSKGQSVGKAGRLSPEGGSHNKNRSSPSRDKSKNDMASGAANGQDGTISNDVSAEAASAERDEKAAALTKPTELITVILAERPFGMSPSKEEGVTGYVVAKLAEGRPADAAGVKTGWRLVEVGGKTCKELDLEVMQKLLKEASLPVRIVFEKPASDTPVPSDDSEDEDEAAVDILDHRADMRKANQSALESIDELPVKREPEGLPEPIKNWQEAVGRGMLNKSLYDKLVAAGLKRPTVIQKHALPIISHQSGHHDMIALAQTGSGKTFAFVIPTVARLVMQGAMPRPFFPGKSPGCPLILALSPTRELAMQTFKEIEVLSKGTSLSQTCIYGGESLKFQQQRIEKAQIDILCATPGRLIDLIDASKISLSFIQSVVLDEADQMFEQSLEIMCAEILTGRDMPDPKSGRQTLLFSATMPPKIRELCPRILRQDRIANLTIGHYGSEHGGSCASIKQIIRWVPDESTRMAVVLEDLKCYWMSGGGMTAAGKKGRVVVFTNQRLQAGVLSNHLMAGGVSNVHLHGKLEQHVREEVFEKFRRGQADVLVATNVASRGLDFADISLVVQYNMPQTIDIYTHRIGRTGRVGQVGCALAYMGPKDRRIQDKLVDFLRLNNQEIPDFLRPRGMQPRRSRSRSRKRR